MMDKNYFNEIVKKIFLTDSPSGFSGAINDVILSELHQMGYTNCKVTNKGTVEVFISGKNTDKKVAIAAHDDTLGLMVRSIASNGNLKVTKVGGPIVPTLDGEYCKVYTRSGKVYTGTILSTSAATHVYPDANTKPRDIDSIEVRLDEIVHNKADVLKLGINNGDYVCYDPKTIITESGFLKSRFIDDKASVCIILATLKYMKDNKLTPNYDTYCYFTNYEEVGHGGAIFKQVDELLAIDMGCIGLDLAGNEYEVSICAKDSAGPYDYELTSRLIELAKTNNIGHVVDIFPFYSSDASASLRAGNDAKAALIGTGVSASHGMERTHLDGITNTMKLLLAYLTK